MWAILAADPVERLSKMVTWSPRAIRASARWEPIKPAPPVINTRMRRVYGLGCLFFSKTQLKMQLSRFGYYMLENLAN